ncbi:hypothetical protein NT6N_33650 [Oceaniferula spumae]|uniref:Ig-like domain-containing protein n=1 Tax=Oceaniferula spumae TaxID=2979115 RepID=A0AAT9FQN2_9BACT
MKRLSPLFLGFLTHFSLSAAPDTPDPTFTANAGLLYNENTTGGVASVLVQPNGKILVGSNEMEINDGGTTKQTSLTRFNVDGTIDTTFGADNESTGSDAGIYYDPPGWSEVHSLGLQSDGKIIAAGVMQGFRIGTKAAPSLEFKSSSILRFNADGTIDTSFQTNGTRASGGFNFIEDVTVDSSDRILCAGGFGGFRNSEADPYTTRYGLARLNADGSLDTTFQIDPHALGVPATGVNINGFFRRAVTDASGKIYVAGYIGWDANYPTTYVSVFARLFPDGSLDPSFAPTLTDIGDFVIEPDGKITAIGFDNGARFFKRFNTDGSVDPSFNFSGGPAYFTARPLRRSPSGQYLLAVAGIANQDKLIRVNSNGSIDPTFAPVTTSSGGHDGYFGTWDIAADGKIYAGSGTHAVGAVETHKIVAFEGDYTPGSTGTISLALGSASVLENNGVYNIPVVRSGGSTGAASVSLSTSNGSASSGADYTAVTTTVNWADGESGIKFVSVPILTDSTIEGDETFTVTLSSVSGASLGSPSSGSVTILDVDSAPSIVAQPVSQTTNAVQTATFSVSVQTNAPVIFQWRLNGADIPGANAPTYTTPALSMADSGNSYDVVVTSSAGSVTSSAATVTVESPDGTPSPDWTALSGVTSASGFTSLPDGTLYFFQAPFNQPRVIKKYFADGTEDTSFTTPSITLGGNHGHIFSLSVAPDGKIYVRGSFDTVGGVARAGLARLNSDGSVDTSFAPDFAATHSIPGDTIFATPQGLYLVLQSPSSGRGLARLTDTGSIDATFKFANASFQNTFSHVRALEVLPDGRLIIGYLRGTGSSVSTYGFARLEADGDVDSTFTGAIKNAPLTNFPADIALRPDGSIFYATGAEIGLMKADGSLDASFNTGSANGSINSIAVVKGKLIASGAFTEFDGTPVGHIVRFDDNGNVDSSFPGGEGANSAITYLNTLDDGSLLAAGSMQTFNTASYPYAVKLLMNDPSVELLAAAPIFENDGSITLTLKRLGDPSSAISVDLATQAGTATEGADYTALNTTVSWGAGDTANKTVTITLLDDSDAEGPEDFIVNLSNPIGTSLLNNSITVTLRDDESVPAISSQPIASSVLENGSTTFAVTASSSFALTYQWYFNGNVISGATASSLTINPVTPADEGTYHVVVSTPHESITSDNVDLEIVPDPTQVSPLYTSPAASYASGSVFLVVPAPDGGAYIGGDFQDFGGNTALDYIAKINEDGSVDTSFTPPALGNTVKDIAVAENGDLYVVGKFTGNIVKLAADGTEDTSFSTNRGTGGNDEALAVDVFPNGDIVVGGAFTAWSGSGVAASNNQNSRVVRLAPDGTPTATRYQNTGSFNYLLKTHALRVLPNGKLLISYETTNSSYAKARLYNADSTVDTSFNYPNSGRRIDHFSLFSDGSFLLAGDNFLAQVGVNGSILATYDTASDWFSAAIQIDGKVIGARNFNQPRVSRYLTNQQTDPIYNAGTKFNNNVRSLALRSDGRLWAAGNFTSYDGTVYPGVVLLENQPIHLAITGQPQSLIQDPGTTATFTCVALGSSAITYQWYKNGTPLSDAGDISGSSADTLVISNIVEANEGDYTCVIINNSGTETSDVAALNVLGSPEIISLSPSADILEGQPTTLSVEAIGAGSLSYQWQKNGSDVSGATTASLEIPNPTTADAGNYTVTISNTLGSVTSAEITLNIAPNPAALSPNFTPLTINGSVNTILPLAGNRALVGGNFSSISDGSITTSGNIAVVNEDGSLEDLPNLATNGTVNKLKLQADGKILVAGSFTTINGVSRNRVARLNADYSLDTSFDTSAVTGFGAVLDIVQEASGTILIAGQFADWSGNPNSAYVTRLTSTGDHDASFASSATNFVNSVIPKADGKILIVGYFTDYGSEAQADNIALLNTDGSLDNTVLYNPGFYYVKSALTTSTGDLLVANSFGNGIRRYSPTAVNDTAFENTTQINGSNIALAEATSGKYLVGGTFTSIGGQSHNGLALLNTDGTPDTSFGVGSGPNDAVYSIAPADSGAIWVGGAFTSYNGVSVSRLMLLKGSPTLTPFQQWAVDENIPAAEAGFTDDADGDGTSNGVEYFYGLNPVIRNAPFNWNPSWQDASGAHINASVSGAGLSPGKYYKIVYIRTPVDDKGLNVELESGNDLSGFDTSNVHAYGAPTIDGLYQTQAYYLTPAIDDTPKLFWRLNISE